MNRHICPQCGKDITGSVNHCDSCPRKRGPWSWRPPRRPLPPRHPGERPAWMPRRVGDPIIHRRVYEPPNKPPEPKLPINRPSFDNRHRPSYPSKPQAIRRIPRMTIAAGFKCTDGIVLFADQEITHIDGSRTKEQKIWTKQYEQLGVVITGSDNWPYLQSTADKIVRTLSGCETLEDAELMIVDTIRTVFEKDISLDSRNLTEPPSFEMIIGIAAEGNFRLLKTSNLAVHPGKLAEFIGAGETLARSYLDSLYLKSSISKQTVNRSVEEAVVAGSYILRQVKESAYGCGGPTDAVVLRPSGEVEPATVAYLDSVFENAKIPMRRLLLAYANFNDSDEKFEEELAWVVSAIRSRRDECKKKYARPFSAFLEEFEG